MKDRPGVITTFLLLMTAGLFAPHLFATSMACGSPPTDEDGYWIWNAGAAVNDSYLSESLDLYHGTLVRLLTEPRDARLEAAGAWKGELDALRFGPSGTADPLLMWIGTEPDSWIVKTLLDRLAYTLDRSLQPVFSKALDHPDDGVRAAALRWYGQVRDDTAVSRMERLWPDTPSWSRGALAKALVRNGSGKYLDEIMRQACGEDGPGAIRYRQEMAEAVLLAEDPAVIPCLVTLIEKDLPGTWNSVRWDALDALLRWENRLDVRQLLFSLAGRKNHPAQLDALAFLEESGFTGSREKILELAMDSAQPDAVRIHALHSLGLLAREHVPLLYRQLENAEDAMTYDSSRLAADFLVESGMETPESIRTYLTGRLNTTLSITMAVETASLRSREPVCHKTPWPGDRRSDSPIEGPEVVIESHFLGNGDHWVAVAMPDEGRTCWVLFD